MKAIQEYISELIETNTASMTELERMDATLLIMQYAEIFASNKVDIERMTLIEHDVDTTDVRPAAQTVRRQSPDYGGYCGDQVSLRSHPAQ